MTEAGPARRVLVVEDDPGSRALAVSRLRAEGHHVHAVESAAEALEALGAQAFEAALLDLRLPDSDGLDLFEAIRRAAPGLPIVIMTAHGTPATATQARLAGASAFLRKPVGRRELVEAIAAALGGGGGAA
jgi:two-component system response regulator GlrR